MTCKKCRELKWELESHTASLTALELAATVTWKYIYKDEGKVTYEGRESSSIEGVVSEAGGNDGEDTEE